jgi:hypothetical protein
MIDAATKRLEKRIGDYTTARTAQDTAQAALDAANAAVDALDLVIVGKTPTKKVVVLDKERVVTIRPETAQDGSYFVGIGRATQAKVQFVPSGAYHHVNAKTGDAVQMTVSADAKSYFVDALDQSFTSPSSAATSAAEVIGLTGRRNGRVFWKDCQGDDCVCQQTGD